MQTVQKFLKNIALTGAMALSLVSAQVMAGSDESQATPAQIQANITLVENYFKAIQTGDLDTVGASLSPDIVWYQPGQNQFSGVQNGANSVFALIGGMMDISGGSFKIDKVHAVMGNGARVAAIVEFSGTRDGAEISMLGVDILTVKDGQISEAWLYSADQAAEDAFWGK